MSVQEIEGKKGTYGGFDAFDPAGFPVFRNWG